MATSVTVGAPFVGKGLADTTAETLAALNPVVNPPAAAASLRTTTGTYPTTSAAVVAASPWNPTKLTYTQWVLATMDSELAGSWPYYFSETTPAAYMDYCRIWAICQAERAQPGPNGLSVGQFMDQVLGT